MSHTSQTPIPPGHAVQVVFTVRASKSLYGYAYGPFKYDELRECFVFENRTFSVEEWETKGAELIQKWYKYRPSIRVEVVALPKEEPAVEAVVEAPATEPEPEATAPAEDSAPVPETESAPEVAPAEPVKRSRSSKKVSTSSE